MAHLSPDQLLDLADGTRTAGDGVPHLASCASCREALAALRGVMAEVTKVPVPEPSPLFWDHFSARVREAVAADASPARHPAAGWSWRVVSMWVAAPVIAVIAVVAVIAMRGAFQPNPELPSASQAAAPAALVPEPLFGAGDEGPSFSFLADLAGDMDLDTALEAGLVPDDTAEHAVAHLNTGELRELARLLQEEIGRTQAS